MKRIIVFILFAVVAITANSQSRKYTINGKIEGAEGVQLQLQKYVGGKMTTVSEAVVKNGKFVMGGSVEYPEMAYLLTADKKFRLNFYIENSDITITGNLAYLADADVKGSKTQDENKELSALIFPVSKQYASTVKEYEEAKKAGNNALAEEKMKQINDMSNQVKMIQLDFIKSHPASFVTPSLLRGISYSMGGSELESVINSLDPAVAKTPIIADLRSRIDVLKSVDLGKKAPDFTLNDPNGKPVALSSLIGKNILLVDFWAGWCGPCRAENPNVVKVYNEFKDKGFDVFGVSLDRTADEWNKAIADDKLTWTQVSDIKFWNSAAAKLYGVNSIPANFLLDKNGIIIAKNLRGGDLYNKIKELLGSN
jgi:peroxiredoxin